MKYLCIDRVEFHVFPHFLCHRDEAKKHDGEVTSAGFVRLTPTGLECYGESTSLGISAHPSDTLRLNALIRETKA